jgi:hypothetical protein
MALPQDARTLHGYDRRNSGGRVLAQILEEVRSVIRTHASRRRRDEPRPALVTTEAPRPNNHIASSSLTAWRESPRAK